MIDNATRIERALARSTVYRFLADLSLYPGATGGRAVPPRSEPAQECARLERAIYVLRQAGYGGAALAPLADLTDLIPPSASSTITDKEYIRVFGHTVSTECPPYETQYGVAHVFEQTNALADLAGCYRAFGLKLHEAAGERLDHVAVELEFMHLLTYKEAYALEHHGADRAELCRDAQVRFLRDHLGTWIDDFTDRVGRRAGQGPYGAYAGALRGFIRAELAFLAVVPARRKTLEPRPRLATAPGCDNCGPPGSGSEA